MNRSLLSLVSYFTCLLFFSAHSYAATFSVTSSSPESNTPGSLNYVIGQVNAAPAEAHTINITVLATTHYGATTITANNVTIVGSNTCTPGANHVIDVKGGAFTIAGSNCVIKGINFLRTSLTITGNNNRVWGCWFNMNDSGTAAGGGTIDANFSSAIFINGGSGNTIGLGGQCRNIFSGFSMTNMVRVEGGASNTIISHNYMGVASDGTTQIGANLNNQNAVFFVSGTQTNCRIDSNVIATVGSAVLVTSSASDLNIRDNDIANVKINGIKIESGNPLNNLSVLRNKIRQVTSSVSVDAEDDGFGIKLRGFVSNSVLVEGNLIGVQSDGRVNTTTDLGCQKNGIYARASIAALTINDNVVCDNGNLSGDREMYSGMFVKAEGENFGSIAITNNYIGVDKFGGIKGNDFAGINVRYVSGTIGSVNVSGNVVGDNGTNGGSTKKSHGIAFEGYKPASSANFLVNSNYVGVFPGTYANIGNYGNGIEMNNCSNFRIGGAGLGNVVGFNKMATTFSDYDGGGIVLTGSSNGLIQGNAVGQSFDGLHNFGNTNSDPHIVPIANHFSAGISVLNSSNNTIGGTSAGLENIVKNNSYGVVLDGALSTGNSLYRNVIASNTNFGVYIGSAGNTVGDQTSFANANIITANGRDGINIYGSSATNNRISRNQIFCNTNQGIKLNYGANQGNSGVAAPVITGINGNTVSGTATAGATIEIYLDDAACQIGCGASTSDNRREGKNFLAAVTATGGNWSYTHASAIDEDNISATATVGSNTSEMSICNILTICPTTQINTTGPITICNTTSTVSLTALDQSSLPGGVTQGWTSSNAGVTFTPNANSNAVTVGNLPTGTTTFTWLVQRSGCPDDPKTINVTVVAEVTPTATASQSSVCSTSPEVTLNASPSAGTWTAVNGTATFSPNATTASATATITSGTSVSFTWTANNAPCNNTATTSAVTVVSSVTPTATATQSSVCSTSAEVTLNATPSTGTWTAVGGTATFSPNATTASATATITSGSSVSFTWTASNAPCNNSATTSAVTVVSTVTPTATATQSSVCSTSAEVTLNATPSAGTWTAVNGTATFSPNATTASATATITSGTSVSFTWTANNAPCNNSATTSAVSVVSSITPTATATQTSVCTTSPEVTLNATPATGTWTAVGGTATFSPDATTASATATITSGTSVSFTWTANNAPCNNTATTSPVSVVTPTSVSASANTSTVCSTSPTVTLTGSPAAGGVWTVLTGSGTATFDNNSSSPATATITSGTAVRFIWTVTTGVCSGADTTDAVNVDTPVPATVSTDPITVCNSTTGSMTANDPQPAATGSWTKLSGTGNIVSGQETSFNPNVENLTIGGTTRFVWTVTTLSGACITRDTVDLVSIDPGAPADAGDDTIRVCNDNFVNLQAVGAGAWSVPTPNTNPSAITFNPDAAHASTTVTGLVEGTYSFVWTITAVVGCPSTSTSTDTVTVIVHEVDAPLIDGDSNLVCLSGSYNYHITNVDSDNDYVWTTGSNLAIQGSSTGTAVVVTANGIGRLTVTASQQGFCPVSSFIDLGILPNPPATTDTSRLATCILTDYVIKTSMYDTLNFNATWTSKGGLLFTSLTDSTTLIGNLVDGMTDTLTYTITGTCGSSSYVYILKVGGQFDKIEASGPSDTLCVTQPRNLNAWVNPPGDYTYYWVSNLNYDNPVINATSHIDSTKVPTYSIRPQTAKNVYFVFAVDKASMCKSDIDTAYVYAFEGQDLNIPNLITPNNDNMNDYWELRDKVTGQDILPGAKFELYNRWGQRVFTMDNYDNRFKADNISDGIYYFNVKSGCGDKEYKGWLQILGNTNP